MTLEPPPPLKIASTEARAKGPSWLPLVLLGIAVGVLFGIGGASVWWRRHTGRTSAKRIAEAVQRQAPWHRIASPTTENLYALWGTGPRDIWTVGDKGPVLHFDGTAWQRVPVSAKMPPTGALHAIWGSGPSDVWTVGKAGMVFHYDGTRFSEVPSGTAEDLSCIHGTDTSTFYIGGRHGVLVRWDGHTLVPMDIAPPTQQHLRSVWASPQSELFAVTTSDANDGSILHFDGHNWTQRQEPARLNQVWGSGPRDVWVAGGRLGNQGVVLHFDGQKWNSVELPGSQSLHSIWGSGPADLWMAGESNRLFHFNGRLWTRAVCDTAESVAGLWGASSMDVWAAGTRGVLCHYNGRD